MSHDVNPLISVVVPSLNRAHYLVSTIDSILEQDYTPVECIVVDGGSTDGTLDILKSYGGRITWISEPDDGHADAINKGWWMSNGEILAWLNADDLYVIPDAISKAVAFLKKNPDVDVVYGDYSIIYSDGTIDPDIVKPRMWDLVYAVKYCYNIICQPASFMRRSILEKVGWLDPEFKNGKDHELWLRIGLAGKIQYAPLHLAYGRIDSGLSQQFDMGKSMVEINKKIFSVPDLPYPFHLAKFRKRAMSNAYVRGSRFIWHGTGQLKPAAQYVHKAFVIDPSNWYYILKTVLKNLLLPFIPFRWQRVILKKIKNIYVY